MLTNGVVVADDTLVGPGQYLGVPELPVRLGELSSNLLVELFPAQVTNMNPIWLELEELSSVDRVTELGGEIHDRVPFSLSNHLAQMCSRPFGIEYGGTVCLDRSKLSRIPHEDNLAVLGDLEDVLQ